MSRIIRIIILLAVINFLSAGCKVERSKPPLDVSKLNMGLEAQIALQKAQEIYQQAKNAGQDLSQGHCLSNALHGNLDYPETMWVLDIAHNPRQAVDNQPENQCAAFREGKAENFIEFDEQGNLIKVYSPLLPQH